MKLSVVIPAYNVGAYIEECVYSVLNQNIDSMEILVVNDGSTDNTLEILRKLESEYSQVRVIDQENAGVSNARNRGCSEAVGEYLTFVDPDDIVEIDAYRTMIERLEKNGSDFIVGNVVRFNNTKVYPSGLHRRIFTVDFSKTSLQEHPELIYDTTCWNKMYRMDFWKANDIQFPEGMIYEDIPLTAKMYFLSKKVDVLTQIVYRWRAREDGDASFTQRRGELQNFKDRMRAFSIVQSLCEEQNITQELRDIFDHKVLSMDIPLYFPYLLDVDDEYRETVFDFIKNYLPKTSRETFLKLPLFEKIAYRLVEQDRLKDFLQLVRLTKFKKAAKGASLIKSVIKREKAMPFIEVLTAEEAVDQFEWKPVCSVKSASWRNDRLAIQGMAYINHLDSSLFNKCKIDIRLVEEDSGDRTVLLSNVSLSLDLKNGLRKSFDSSSKVPSVRLYNYSFSHFSFLIPTEVLSQLKEDKSYLVECVLSAKNISKTFYLNSPAKGNNPRPSANKIKEHYFKVSYNPSWIFKLKKESLNNSVSAIHVEEEKIVIQGHTTFSEREVSLVDANGNNVAVLPFEIKDTQFTISIDREWIQEKIASYHNALTPIYSLRFSKNESLINDVKTDYAQYGMEGIGQLSVEAPKGEEFSFSLRPFLPQVTQFSQKEKAFTAQYLCNRELVVEGLEAKAYLVSEKEQIPLETTFISEQGNGALFEFVLPIGMDLGEAQYQVCHIQYPKDLSPQEVSQHLLQVLTHRTISNVSIVEHPILFPKNVELLLSSKEGEIRHSLVRSEEGSYLTYVRKAEWSAIDDGPRRKEIFRRLIYPLFRLLPLSNKIFLLESFWGREVSDNPKAIYDYLAENYPDLTLVLPLKDILSKVDKKTEKTRVVRYASWKYYYYLARSKYLFNNVNFPDSYVKRKGAVEVQTMHGTPLKKIGLDNEGEVPPSQIDNYIAKCRRWDYLTVPSDYVGEIARSAFRYENTLLKTGYPRNDSLFLDIEDVRQDIIEKYNLPRDKKIILYAPTWRVKGKYKLRMDLQEMKEKLGDEYVLVIKLHQFVTQDFSLEGVEDFAYVFGLNVQISDLYKVADIMVTDYSSVMFDYAILHKPMLFYVYDYEDYKNNLRGFYFDFEEEAPGPLLQTPEELISELQQMDTFKQRYQEKIEKFEKQYIQYDTGNACEQLMDELLGK